MDHIQDIVDMPDQALIDPIDPIDPMDDDLFGDAADDLGVVMPLMSSDRLPPALTIRIAEMRRSGCSTQLAWSHTGSIAQVSSDGSMVDFRAVLREPKTGLWKLSQVSKHSVLAQPGRRYVHVQYNGMGSDLALVDNFGVFQMYSFGHGVLSRPHRLPDDAVQPDGRSELDAVVGLHWLPLWPVEFRNQYVTPATKIDGRWYTQLRQRDQNEPRAHHPGEGRNALLYVTVAGKLTLMFQNEMGAWSSVSHDLELHESTKDLLSHAALSENGDHLLMVTHDEGRRLRMYRVVINWNASPLSKNQSFHVLAVAPTLDVRNLATEEDVLPQHSNPARLSHLHIIPPTPAFIEQGSHTVSTVLAVFQHAPVAFDLSHTVHENFNVILRWQVESATPTLHSSFTKLKPGGPVPVQPAVTILRRQPDLLTRQVMLAIAAQCNNTIVAFAGADATVSFRDRATWATLDNYGDTNMAASLAQSGFAHLPDAFGVHAALSSDGSAVNFSKVDGTSEMRSMAFAWQALDDGLGDNGTYIESAVVCLARQYALLSLMNASTDETLSLLPHDLSPDLRALFIQQVITMMGRPVDVTMLDGPKPAQIVSKEVFTFRVLSAQMALNITYPSGERSFASQYAYVVLNLKASWLALTQTITRQSQDATRSDILPSLTGLVHWALDLMMYIADILFTAKRTINPAVSVKTGIEKFIQDTHSPAVQLLLCSFPRALLKMHTPYILNYLRLVKGRVQGARSIQERQQLIGAFEMVRALPLSPKEFDELISLVETRVQECYHVAGTSADRRTEIEIEMMTRGRIPDELAPVIETILDGGLTKLREATDTGKLYLWNTTWLGITSSSPAKAGKRIDIIKKTPLTASMQLRTCRRCGAQMEDIPLEEVRDLPGWLQLAQKHCVCFGNWWTPT